MALKQASKFTGEDIDFIQPGHIWSFTFKRARLRNSTTYGASHLYITSYFTKTNAIFIYVILFINLI